MELSPNEQARREKISNARRGKPRSAETKAKISASKRQYHERQRRIEELVAHLEATGAFTVLRSLGLLPAN